MARLALILYAAWCIVVVAAFASAGFSGYSPFADGGRGGGFFYAGGTTGPRHK